jgi:hypothetical protein
MIFIATRSAQVLAAFGVAPQPTLNFAALLALLPPAAATYSVIAIRLAALPELSVAVGAQQTIAMDLGPSSQLAVGINAQVNTVVDVAGAVTLNVKVEAL